MASAASLTSELRGTLALGNVALNFDTYAVEVDGSRVRLANKEFDLLAYLMRAADRIVSCQELLDHVWSERGDPSFRGLRVVIYRLRAKLKNSRPFHIVSVRDRGYGFLRRHADTAAGSV